MQAVRWRVAIMWRAWGCTLTIHSQRILEICVVRPRCIFVVVNLVFVVHCDRISCGIIICPQFHSVPGPRQAVYYI